MTNIRLSGFTFDDVCLIPQYSEIKSRADVDLSSNGLLGQMRLPIISANMDTVTEAKMAVAMTKAGARGIIHKYILLTEFYNQLAAFEAECGSEGLIMSIGVGESAKAFVEQNMIESVKTICVDVAHGNCKQVVEMVEFIRDLSSETVIIAGNVATGDGVYRLARAGADIIKVGIGPGSLCSTRVVTGHGVPQLDAIESCVKAAQDINFHERDSRIEIIADGGIRNSGDIAKALAAGADYVMLGSLLSATDEAPGEMVHKDGFKFKQYRGMASREVQDQLGKKVAAEGVSQLKPYKGSVVEVLHELEWGLRSALTYSGASNLEQFRDNAEFMQVSSHSYIEGTPHGLHALHT